MIIGEKSELFWAAFSISFFSSCFAIGKFLKSGPIKLLESKGPLDGYLNYGFIMVFLNVGLTILLKSSVLLAPLLTRLLTPRVVEKTSTLSLFTYWILMNILPQFIFVSTLTKIHIHTLYLV